MTDPAGTGEAGRRPSPVDDAARIVPCPKCRAPIFEECSTRRGGPHQQRVRAGLDAVAQLALALPPSDGDSFVLVCQRCLHPITREQPGYAVVDRRAAMRQAVAWEAQRLEHGGQMPPRPPLLRWQLLHRTCDPTPDAPGHWRLRHEDISDTRRLLRASSLLVEAPWAWRTNWTALVRYVVRGSAILRDLHMFAVLRHVDAAKRAALQQNQDADAS